MPIYRQPLDKNDYRTAILDTGQGILDIYGITGIERFDIDEIALLYRLLCRHDVEIGILIRRHEQQTQESEN